MVGTELTDRPKALIEAPVYTWSSQVLMEDISTRSVPKRGAPTSCSELLPAKDPVTLKWRAAQTGSLDGPPPKERPIEPETAASEPPVRTGGGVVSPGRKERLRTRAHTVSGPHQRPKEPDRPPRAEAADVVSAMQRHSPLIIIVPLGRRGNGGPETRLRHYSRP